MQLAHLALLISSNAWIFMVNLTGFDIDLISALVLLSNQWVFVWYVWNYDVILEIYGSYAHRFPVPIICYQRLVYEGHFGGYCIKWNVVKLQFWCRRWLLLNSSRATILSSKGSCALTHHKSRLRLLDEHLICFSQLLVDQNDGVALQTLKQLILLNTIINYTVYLFWYLWWTVSTSILTSSLLDSEDLLVVIEGA